MVLGIIIYHHHHLICMSHYMNETRNPINIVIYNIDYGF